MGAVDAVAPTIFSQWVQTMYSAPTILWSQTTFSSCINTEGVVLWPSFRNAIVSAGTGQLASFDGTGGGGEG